MNTITGAGILGRIIQPEKGGWDHFASTAVLSVSFSDNDRERMNELLALGKMRELHEEQHEKLASYHKAGRMLELLKARARISPQQKAA